MAARFVRTLGASLIATLTAGSAGRAADQAASTPRPCPGRSGAGVPVRSLGAGGPRLILDENFPDPFVARFGRLWHAYATGNQIGGGQMNVQLVRSRNLRNWSAPVEALPAANLPAWVDRRHPQVWAPEVMRIAGRYVLYFNARHATLTRTERPPSGPRVLQRHCLGTAVADTPEGPFRGVDAPLVCAAFEHGTIDASPFADRGRLFVYYKDDANCCGGASSIWVQELTPDGLAARDPATRLLAADDSPEVNDDWEWLVVEAPTMVRRRGAYYLFYSGNFFGNKNYSVAYLRCAGPRGPCTDPGENPILWSHLETPLIGPGHQSVLERRGRSYVFFHGWNEDPDARERPGVHKRCLYVSRIFWDRTESGDERPRIAGGEPSVPPVP